MTASSYQKLLKTIREAFPGMVWMLNNSGRMTGSVTHSLSSHEKVTFEVVGEHFECTYENEGQLLVSRNYAIHAPLLAVISVFRRTVDEEAS